MANYTSKEEKVYDFNGHVVYNYQASRNGIIKAWNSIYRVFNKNLPKAKIQDKIEFLRYKEVKDTLDKLPQEEKDKINILMKQFYKRKFDMERELEEEMLYPIIDKYIGFDKVLEDMQK